MSIIENLIKEKIKKKERQLLRATDTEFKKLFTEIQQLKEQLRKIKANILAVKAK